MSGILLASAVLGLSKRLDATVTAADLGGGTFGYSFGVLGSIDDDTFTDATNTTRTIREIYGDGGTDTITVLSLAGNSIPNTEATFSYIITDAGILTRASATYNGSNGSYSTWTWGNGSFVGGASSHNLEVWA